MLAGSDVEQPSERSARASVMRRILDLSEQEQLQIYNELRDHLVAHDRGPVLRVQDDPALRLEGLQAVTQVAEHLGLTDRAPTIAEYQREAPRLGIELSKSQIIRRWLTWRSVGAAMLQRGRVEIPPKITGGLSN
jgi:hypothetical protein